MWVQWVSVGEVCWCSGIVWVKWEGKVCGCIRRVWVKWEGKVCGCSG